MGWGTASKLYWYGDYPAPVRKALQMKVAHVFVFPASAPDFSERPIDAGYSTTAAVFGHGTIHAADAADSLYAQSLIGLGVLVAKNDA